MVRDYIRRTHFLPGIVPLSGFLPTFFKSLCGCNSLTALFLSTRPQSAKDWSSIKIKMKQSSKKNAVTWSMAAPSIYGALSSQPAAPLIHLHPPIYTQQKKRKTKIPKKCRWITYPIWKIQKLFSIGLSHSMWRDRWHDEEQSTPFTSPYQRPLTFM